MTPIHLYNTLTRRKEAFEPLNPERVTLYVCGPTVYNYAHIGNARPVVIFDLLFRLLQRYYPQVVFARNITDVDDKIYTAAAEQGVAIDVITDRFAQAYREDTAALGALPPTVEPHATRHIGPIIEMISELIEGGHAYQAEGHVLFDVGSYPEYGKLSGRDRRELVAGARVEVAPYKRDPADFVLWKPSSGPQPGWDSPWGFGRPGWHIECSAMSAAHLGETIDIHAGGQDLVFPHHENELAQSECAHGGKPFARYWLHNGFVNVEHRKMSKSLGNVLTIRSLLQQHPGEVLRYVLLAAHYRQPLDWSDKSLEQAKKTLDRLYGTLRDAPAAVSQEVAPDPGVLDPLCDDLNTCAALARLNEMAREVARAGAKATPQQVAILKASAGVLGLLQQDPAAWFHDGDVDPIVVESLIEQRNAARAERDFSRADAIRDELTALGVVLEDGANGTRWRLREACGEMDP